MTRGPVSGPRSPARTEPPADGAPRTFTAFGQTHACAPLRAGLYVVATPIGNLEDISLRALATVAGADLIACEDTRVTARLLARYAIERPLTAYHDHNADAARPKLIARLLAGDAVVLVSDAGTPLVSDPGFRLVREAHEAGVTVTSIPGPSAVLAALTSAGLPTDRFFFEGFLPPRGGARRTRIGEIAAIPATLVMFETGPRIAEALADLAGLLGEREAAVCRELTKLHEEVRRGDLARLAAHYAGDAEIRGEFVLVVAAPARSAEASPEEIDAALREALAVMSLKDAVAAVTAATGSPRRTVYGRALALNRTTTDAGAHDD